MVNHKTTSVIIHIVSALIYGGILSIIINFIYAPKYVIKHLNELAKKHKLGVLSDENSGRDSIVISLQKSLPFSVLAIFVFGIGYLILSYVLLDGNLRLYFLFSAVFSYLTADKFCVALLRGKIPSIAYLFFKFYCDLKKYLFNAKIKRFFSKNDKNEELNDKSTS